MKTRYLYLPEHDYGDLHAFIEDNARNNENMQVVPVSVRQCWLDMEGKYIYTAHAEMEYNADVHE